MRPIRLAGLLAALFLLAGCSIGLLGDGGRSDLFRFGVPEQAQAASPDRGRPQRTIALERVRFAREIEGDRVLTSRGESVLYVEGMRWAAPAADLFTQAVLRQFAGRLPETLLASPRGAGGATLALQLTVDRFEARYPAAAGKDDPPTIVVGGTAALSAQRGGPPIALHRFAVEEPATANGKAAIAAAFDRAVDRYTILLADWTRGAPAN
ncbi:MAG: ABC-type transport auxiliary lipoprotein family protein [Sphingomonadales bacterium]